MRTYHTPGGYQPHAKNSLFYFFSYTKVGLFISFSGCLGLLADVWGFWRVFAGPCQPTCALGLDMSIRRGLGYSGLALGCEGCEGGRKAVKVGVRL